MTFENFKKQIKRTDSKNNNKIHWFSSIFSPYISFISYKLRLSADQMTIIFFLTGILSSIFFISNDLFFVLTAFILFRLHIIFDMSDGDLARINKTFSIRGVYWDSMSHNIINPLIGIGICLSFYYKFHDIIFLFLMSITCLIISLTSAVKNNYYKALYSHKLELKKKTYNLQNGIFGKVFFLVSELLGMEGLILFKTLDSLYNFSKEFILIFLVFYLLGNLMVIVIKFYQNSYKGGTISKL
tara:strand:+ start:451 stop:1176 length:726 start_codon:yes stop_codon:yes gene_type:complete